MQGGRGVGALAARGHHMDAAVHGPAASMRRAVVESDQEPGMPRPSCRLFLFFMGVMRTGGERKFALQDFEEEDYKQCSNSDSAQSRSHVPLWSRAVRASAFARCALLSSLRLDVAGVQGGKHRDAVGAVLGAAGFRSFKEGRLSARKPSGTSWQPLLLSGRELLAPSARGDFGAQNCAVVESGGSAPEAVAELSSSKLSAKKESLLQFSKSRKSSCRSRERAVSVIDKQRSSSRVALDRLSLPLLRGARAFELRTTGAASQAFGRALDWKALSSTARALGARRCALPFCPATAGALPLAVFSFSAFASSCAWQKTHAQKAQVARRVCLR